MTFEKVIEEKIYKMLMDQDQALLFLIKDGATKCGVGLNESTLVFCKKITELLKTELKIVEIEKSDVSSEEKNKMMRLAGL